MEKRRAKRRARLAYRRESTLRRLDTLIRVHGVGAYKATSMRMLARVDWLAELIEAIDRGWDEGWNDPRSCPDNDL